MENINKWFFIASIVFQVLTLILLLLKTSFMVARFGNNIPEAIQSEHVFLGLGIAMLASSIICCGVYGFKNRRNLDVKSNSHARFGIDSDEYEEVDESEKKK